MKENTLLELDDGTASHKAAHATLMTHFGIYKRGGNPNEYSDFVKQSSLNYLGKG